MMIPNDDAEPAHHAHAYMEEAMDKVFKINREIGFHVLFTLLLNCCEDWYMILGAILCFATSDFFSFSRRMFTELRHQLYLMLICFVFSTAGLMLVFHGATKDISVKLLKLFFMHMWFAAFVFLRHCSTPFAEVFVNNVLESAYQIYLIKGERVLNFIDSIIDEVQDKCLKLNRILVFHCVILSLKYHSSPTKLLAMAAATFFLVLSDFLSFGWGALEGVNQKINLLLTCLAVSGIGIATLALHSSEDLHIIVEVAALQLWFDAMQTLSHQQGNHGS
ncbi:uncharacterized protein LOC130731609 [Lotus japonicus]|uniref:uncharacterized protein LOC130731609 n=1 Tax=Lotus japonicus TaxID=34305 RepID=UPI00258446F7|nr:uncharacterized protein LOC130731609 [Lotus japonicus]XP_057439872.1 uncharacterized protein LOC130731609 [Lotus japonicus]